MIGLFFDSEVTYDEHGAPVYDRPNNAEQLREMFQSFLTNGVVSTRKNNTGSELGLMVTPSTGMTVSVNPGMGWINGACGWSKEKTELELDRGSEQSRIDLIVLRLNLNPAVRNIDIFVKKGTPAGEPIVPQLQRDLAVNELCLAKIVIPAHTSTIADRDITDMRLDTEVCGIVTGLVKQIDTTQLYNQIQADLTQFKTVEQAEFKTWIDSFKSNSQDYMDTAEADFNTWFASIKGHLSEDVAGNLLNLINTKLDKNLFNQPNGVAGLDASGKIKQMPTVTDIGATPASHNTDKLTATPVHGIKWLNNRLQFFDGTTWTYIEIGGNAGLPPENITGIAINSGNGCLKISWHDSTNPNWDGTKLVRKVGSYPNSVTDGVLILDNKVKDKYATTPFVDANLTNGTTYYYQFFPYTDNNVFNDNTANRAKGIPNEYKTYGVQIDLSNSNPETCLTYTDDAVGMTPASAEWDEFFGHKPCLFKNGAVVGYLNPLNFAQFEDGSAADITSGSAGDVMIEFPRRGLTINTVGDKITVKMTKDPDNSNFGYLAHTRGTESRRNFYIGAYLGCVKGTSLQSISQETPLNDKTFNSFRSMAQNKGKGYEISGFYQVLFRQCMYILKYKNLNSQNVLGVGIRGTFAASCNTGTLNQKGMDVHGKSNQEQMKLFGCEDVWGHLGEFIEGAYIDHDGYLTTATTEFDPTGTGYTRQIQCKGNLSGMIKVPLGTTETGFIIKETGGSTSTFFCDKGAIYTSSSSVYGSINASWETDSPGDSGMFNMKFTGSTNSEIVGARLMFL